MDSLATPGAAPPAPLEYTWVATAAVFEEAVEVLMPATRLAIDIEADSLYHYFEKVCLIQISTDSHTFVLDPLALGEMLRSLSSIMSDQAVEKVFHAAAYDVLCLRRDYGYTFTNIFDTHLAAQLLGYEQLGLSALMEKLLGVVHSKHRQRDDWSHRPLAVEQLEYAAMDTHHLLRLRDLLEGELSQKDRLSWALEEFQAAALAEQPDREFDPEGFRRIKNARELSLRELAILRALYLLRDRYARELDVPPFKVLTNSVLLDLARKPPRSPRDMFHRPGISFRVARKFAGEILSAIECAQSEDPAMLEPPARSRWKPPIREARLRLERLKLWRVEKAKELALHVGVIFPGTLLETLADFPPADILALGNVQGMRSWRVKQFGEEILKILHSI